MSRLSRRALLWLVPLWITLHNLEEMAGMGSMLAALPGKIPGWLVDALAGAGLPPSYRQFLLMLLVVTALPYLLASLGGARRARGPRTFLLVTTQAVMFVNVFSHLVSMAVMGGYVPGLVTALAINLPFSLYLFAVGLRQGWLRWGDLVYLLPVALVLHGPGLLGLTALSGWLV